MPRAQDAADEIKRLYYATTKQTVAKDLERAIALLISLDSDEARERVAVYMDGLSQLRSEWSVKTPPSAAPPHATAAPARSPLKASRAKQAAVAKTPTRGR